jgi:pilus assembly protein Flp/PilA
MDKIVNFLKHENGASLAEYGILVALIAAVAIGAVTTLGGNIAGVFENIAGLITTGGGSGG